MPRPERALDPDAGPVELLAAELRELRRQSGTPGYRQLAAETGYSVAALANAAGGRRLPSLAVTLAFVRACGEDPKPWERRWRRAASEWVAKGANGGEHAPYLGLTAYTQRDADRFFGRRDVLEQLRRLLRQHRLVAVVGPSGCGKSSLLQAGLMPAYEAVRITPGASLERALEAAPELLVVDQFTADQAAAFVRELAAHVPEGRTRVVIGIRSDQYSALPDRPAIMLEPLTEAELRDVIGEPARQAGLSVERALMTKLVDEALGHAGALPLVSHALLETWRHRRGDVLTLAGFTEAGGLAGGVARAAEDVFRRLDGRQQATARHVLSRIGAARRVERDELDFPDADVVLSEFAAARLIVLDRHTVELAHESLIDAWPRLHDWLHTDREGQRRHRQLTDASRFWRAHDHDPGALYRGARLAAWDGHRPEPLNPLERSFLAASRDRLAHEQAASRRRTRLALVSLTAGVVALSLLAAAALGQSRRANDQRQLALTRQLVANARDELQRDQELALLLAREAYDTKPIEEAQAALRQTVVDSRIRAVVPAGQGQVFGVAYSPDGRFVASSGADNTVRVRQLSGPSRTLRAGARPGTPTFSRDGRRLAAPTGDAITVWDLTGADAPVVLHGPAAVSAVAFSADGTELAAAGLDGAVRIWDGGLRQSPPAPRVLAVGGQLTSVAFSADGRHLAAGGDGPIWIWDATGPGPARSWNDATGPGPARELDGHHGPVLGLAFSPDGRRLASSSADGTARVWSVEGGPAPVVLRGDDGTLDTVAFSPDGRDVATGSSDDNTVRVWNADAPDDPLVLRGHHGPVWGVAFSPDGRRLVSSSGDGTLRFWDPAYPGGASVWRAHQAPVRGLAVSRAGDLIASGGEDGVVRAWSADGRPRLELHGHTGGVLGVALSADGRWIASAGRDRTVRVWPTAGTAAPTVLSGAHGPEHAVAFSPDSRFLASAADDGTVEIRDPTGIRAPLERRGAHGPIFDVAFSPDGSRIAAGDQDGTVWIWPVTGAGPVVVLRDPVPGLVWSIAFSPDGRRLASSGHDGTVRIWNTDGRGQPLILTGHQRLVWSVAFSPDGRRLASTGADGTLRVWSTADGRQLVAYRGQRSLTEQVRFAPDGKHLITAHRDGTIRRWDCEACAPIDRVRALADGRVTRTLTADERREFL